MEEHPVLFWMFNGSDSFVTLRLRPSKFAVWDARLAHLLPASPLKTPDVHERIGRLERVVVLPLPSRVTRRAAQQTGTAPKERAGVRGAGRARLHASRQRGFSTPELVLLNSHQALRREDRNKPTGTPSLAPIEVSWLSSRLKGSRHP